jgi:(E)-4-hydroxy-3-methyl-but-2-enyl pyrophosphate reductase
LRIRVAKHIGFCFGVRRAIELAEKAAAIHGKVYTFGSLIHNAAVVERLAGNGVITAETLAEIPEGAHVVIRSHGVPPETYAACEAHKLIIIDATCPFVRRIHEIALEEVRKGRHVMIVGDPSHPECIGINGCCGGKAFFVRSLEDVLLVPQTEAVSLIAQTTTSVALFEAAAAQARLHFSDLHVFRTICSTTEARQKEAEELSKSCTRMVVIGDENSSNTQKLLSVCKKHCKHIQSLAKHSELSLEKIHADDIIGIVSGASAPDWIIRL